MKKSNFIFFYLKVVFLICILGAVALIIIACENEDITPPTQISAPQNLFFDYQSNQFKWDAVEGAYGYLLSYGGHNYVKTTDTYADIPIHANHGTWDFIVEAHNAFGTSSASIKFASCGEIDEINANVRIEGNNLVWDEFEGVGQKYTYSAYINGENVKNPKIGIVNGIPFYYFKNYSIGETSVRISAGFEPVYKYAKEIDGIPTFYYTDRYISEPFNYNVKKTPVPTNVFLNKQNGYLSWDPVECTTKYCVDIYKGGSLLLGSWDTSYSMDSLSLNIVSNIWYNTRNINASKFGAGSYNFRVWARSDTEVEYIEGIPTLYADSDKSDFLDESCNIQFVNLPQILVQKEQVTNRFTWDVTTGVSYGFWLQKGEKRTYISIPTTGYLSFEYIQQKIESSIEQGYIDSFGDVTITITSSSMTFIYDSETDVLTCYNDVSSEPILFLP